MEKEAGGKFKTIILVIFCFIALSNVVYASHAPGLLYDSTNPIIDYDHSTYTSFSRNQYSDYLDLGKTYTLIKMTIHVTLSARGFVVYFYDQNKNLITSVGFLENTTVETRTINVQDVRYVRIRSTSEYTEKVYEFQVYAEHDTEPPVTPTGLSAIPGDGQVQLTWNANTERDLSHYVIYRNGAKIGTSTSASYTDTTVTNGTTYTYTVSAVDTSGNESEQSSPVTATPEAPPPPPPPDTTPPATPTGLTAFPGNGQVQLSWDANTESDFSHYVVYRDGERIATVTVPNYTDDTVTNGETYSYTVAAVDENGNESPQSAAVTATPTDYVPPPEPPSNLKVSAGHDFAKLTWNLAPYAEEYIVFVNGAEVGRTSRTYFTVTGLEPETEYTFAVKATNSTGESGTVTATAHTRKAPELEDGADRIGENIGFSVIDVIVNAIHLLGSLASFILLGLVMYFLPKLIDLLKQAAR